MRVEVNDWKDNTKRNIFRIDYDFVIEFYKMGNAAIPTVRSSGNNVCGLWNPHTLTYMRYLVDGAADDGDDE